MKNMIQCFRLMIQIEGGAYIQEIEKIGTHAKENGQKVYIEKRRKRRTVVGIMTFGILLS